jgi:hypothetical protein
MKISGNLRKMNTSLVNGRAEYHLPLFDVLEPSETIAMNQWVGREIAIQWEQAIHCIVTGKKIKKTYGEGMSFDAQQSSPQAVESILRPELSRIHEGIALRDAAWEEAHHNQPHYVYLSRTSGIKVGVTRTVNVPSRWIDQGAVEAIVLAETPYRQLAGLIEVELKSHFNDKTQWNAMLRPIRPQGEELLNLKDQAMDRLGEAYEPFFSDHDEVTTIEYPVLNYPAKIASVKFEKTPEIRSTLVGIKGQYLLFGNGMVLNIRSQSGYRVTFELPEA